MEVFEQACFNGIIMVISDALYIGRQYNIFFNTIYKLVSLRYQNRADVNRPISFSVCGGGDVCYCTNVYKHKSCQLKHQEQEDLNLHAVCLTKAYFCPTKPLFDR